MPNCKVKLRYSFSGAVVAALLFEFAKFAFTFYVTRFSGYQLLYGALAAIPVFLIWLYFSWLIILFGVLIFKKIPGESKFLFDKYESNAKSILRIRNPVLGFK